MGLAVRERERERWSEHERGRGRVQRQGGRMKRAENNKRESGGGD